MNVFEKVTASELPNLDEVKVFVLKGYEGIRDIKNIQQKRYFLNHNLKEIYPKYLNFIVYEKMLKGFKEERFANLLDKALGKDNGEEITIEDFVNSPDFRRNYHSL